MPERPGWSEPGPVPAVIALLEAPVRARVEALFARMEAEFGVGRGFPGGVPHITFHVAGEPFDEEARAIVARVARETAPFVMASSGFGVFTGPEPVVFVNVARSPEAAVLAARLGASPGGGASPYYEAGRWVPHITLAHGNLAGADLPGLLAWLARVPLSWELPVEAIQVARELPEGLEVLAEFALEG